MNKKEFMNVIVKPTFVSACALIVLLLTAGLYFKGISVLENSRFHETHIEIIFLFTGLTLLSVPSLLIGSRLTNKLKI